MRVTHTSMSTATAIGTGLIDKYVCSLAELFTLEFWKQLGKHKYENLLFKTLHDDSKHGMQSFAILVSTIEEFRWSKYQLEYKVF